MVYDSARQVLVLFGGEDSNGTLLGDTWIYGPDGTAPNISHTPVTEGCDGYDIEITAGVTDAEGDPLTVTLYYRITGDPSYDSDLMTANGSTYTGTIPASYVTTAGVDYYISATDGYFTVYDGTPDTPHQVTVAPAVGSLKVTLNPPGAVSDGAQWRRVGTATWYNSDEVETDIQPGQYQVEFTVPNPECWLIPNNIDVTIDACAQTETGANYTEAGTLAVNIEPPEVRATARWSVDGGVNWFSHGESLKLSVGGYTITFNDVVDYNKPANTPVSITQCATAEATGTYTPQKGHLTVYISPQGAIDDGGQWSVDGSNWYGNGYTLDLDPGNYTVQFNDITANCWWSPDNIPVTITAGVSTEETGVYTAFGYLQGSITPQEAIDAGAQWKAVKTGYDSGWQSSGATLTVETGDYTVQFSAVVNFDAPADQPAAVTKCQTTPVTGDYIRHTGSLQVTIEPQGAIDAGAQWRVVEIGGDPWHNSGYTLADIPTGSYTVEFYVLDPSCWDSPSDIPVTITKDNTTSETGVYTGYGNLQINIEPEDAVAGGGKWRRVGTTTWLDSGAVENHLEAGISYEVEFKAIDDWQKPNNINPTVPYCDTAIESGTYTALFGELMVTITPQGAVTDGAQWKATASGFDTGWKNSGEEIRLDPGNYTVKFKDLEWWRTPDDIPVLITAGNATNESGEYLASGNLQVTILPQEVVNAGAKWRRVGAVEWRSSGTIEYGMPVGNYQIEFKDVRFWNTPSNKFVEITHRETKQLTGVYVRCDAWIRVYIRPVQARNHNPPPTWSIDGVGSGYSHGQTIKVLAGYHTIRFTHISGWTKPGPINVTADCNQTVVREGWYTLNTTMASSDYNGDGISDPAIFRPSDGTWIIYGLAQIKHGNPEDVPVPGDYNGDGLTEMAVFRPSAGIWWIRGKGAVNIGQDEDVPVPGDYNGDGKTDIAVYRPSTGKWIFRSGQQITYGVEDGVPLPGDYDGDGKTDVAIYRPSDSRWYIHGLGSAQFGTEGDVPVPSDYNGDGVTDIAVFRPSEGKWYIRGLGNVQFGQEGDIPTPGDYNGDGITEFSIFRPSEGKWYVYGMFEETFGQEGDVPLVRGK